MTTIAISVSEFKRHCLDVIRGVERNGASVDLTRRGKVVVRLMPTASVAQGTSPWLRLRDRGVSRAGADDSVLDTAEFDALPKGFHGDPADRIIVATARAHGLPLGHAGRQDPPLAQREAVETVES